MPTHEWVFFCVIIVLSTNDGTQESDTGVKEMAQYVNRFHQNMSADGNGSIFAVQSKGDKDIGHLIIHASGTFGSGTVQLHFKSNNNVWRNTGAVALTADGWAAVVPAIDEKNPGGIEYRVVVTGSTSPTIFYEVNAAGNFDIFLDF